MTKKAQTSLLVNPITRDRSLMLAAVRNEAQAEVNRTLIERMLPIMEKEHRGLLDRLQALAARFGMTPAALAQKMLDDRLTLEALEPHDRYPMTAQV